MADFRLLNQQQRSNIRSIELEIDAYGHAAVEVPHRYRCPISGEMFEDPVVAEDGHTYERAFVAEWFKRGHMTSPLTGASVGSSQLTPNSSMKSLILEFVEENPGARRAEVTADSAMVTTATTATAATAATTATAAAGTLSTPTPARRQSRVLALQNHLIQKIERYHVRLSKQHAVVAMRQEIERLRQHNSALVDQVHLLEVRVADMAPTPLYQDEDGEFFGFPDDDEW